MKSLIFSWLAASAFAHKFYFEVINLYTDEFSVRTGNGHSNNVRLPHIAVDVDTRHLVLDSSETRNPAVFSTVSMKEMGGKKKWKLAEEKTGTILYSNFDGQMVLDTHVPEILFPHGAGFEGLSSKMGYPEDFQVLTWRGNWRFFLKRTDDAKEELYVDDKKCFPDEDCKLVALKLVMVPESSCCKMM